SHHYSARFMRHTRFLVSHFFFLSGYALHRPLHSFPTRRSSDLTASPTLQATFQQKTYLAVASSKLVNSKEHGSVAKKQFAGSNRSEEHTSELQSRRDLVCRLLLEKKKKTVACHPLCSYLDQKNI